MKKFIFISILLVFSAVSITKADSPITSTPFYKAYMDEAIVAHAAEVGTIDAEIAEYLLKRRKPLDVKAAVINALSWDFDGKDNAGIFKTHIAEKYGKATFSELQLDELTGYELMCLGYLTVMDNYFEPKAAILYLEKAATKEPQSYTVHILLAITKAQEAMDYDWCKVWQVTEEVVNNDSLKMDMRPEANEIILDYMRLYQSSCE